MDKEFLIKIFYRIILHELNVKEKLEHIDRYERNKTNDGYFIFYTSYESDDGIQYMSEQHSMNISDQQIKDFSKKWSS